MFTLVIFCTNNAPIWWTFKSVMNLIVSLNYVTDRSYWEWIWMVEWWITIGPNIQCSQNKKKSVAKLLKSIVLNSDWLKFEPKNLCIDRLLFKQHKIKLQNSDRSSRTNVLRACQQRVGLYTKFTAGDLITLIESFDQLKRFGTYARFFYSRTYGTDFSFWDLNTHRWNRSYAKDRMRENKNQPIRFQ